MMTSETIFQKLQRRLIREENLPMTYTAILAAQALYQFAPAASEAARRWAEGESIADFVMADVCVREIQQELGGTEFQALCVLNALENKFDAFAEATMTARVDYADIPDPPV